MRFGGIFQTRLNQSTKIAHVGGAGAGVVGEERRLRVPRLEVLEDRRRVGDDEVAVDQDGDERLAGDLLDGRAVLGVDPDRLDLEPLVGQGERDAVDVGRVGEPVELEHGV